jgi:hypothetical protein
MDVLRQHFLREGPLKKPEVIEIITAVTEIMTICFSEIARIEISPEKNAFRRSDPSPKVLMDPVRVNTIFSCSSS